MQENKNFKNTRQYYRIKYPSFYRPKIKIQEEDRENDVVELSERGVRFLYNGTLQLHKGLELHVTITFYDDEAFQFTGELLKADKEDVILRFTDHLPLSRIMKEQIYLRTHSIGHM